MKTFELGRVTPQSKAIAINNKFGNKGIKNQQGSTVIKYDTLPIDGRTEFRFFEGSANRQFPDTNCTTDGNKLGVGYSMVIERAYLSVITKVEGRVTQIEQLVLGGTAPEAINLSEFSFTLANSEVIKQVPVLSWLPEFNKAAENNLNTNFEFDTQVVVPPLLEFVGVLRAPFYTAPVAELYLRLTIEGSGAIISPRATF